MYVSLSLKEEMEYLLQKKRIESATEELGNSDVQITGTSDSEKSPLKSIIIYPLRKLQDDLNIKTLIVKILLQKEALKNKL